MINVTIIGASGYSGAELVRLLAGHPGARVASITSTSLAGEKFTELYPNMLGSTDLVFDEFDTVKAAESDVVFLALPHGLSMETVPRLLDAGAPKIIDLSGDFRLTAVEYETWYKKPHSCPELLEDAVYGLSEVNREKISQATLTANPGCFPTGIALAAAPLAEADLIGPEITANCLTGVSGAGRAASDVSHFCRMDENAAAYKIGGVHQHTPEIEKAVRLAGGPEAVRASFTPVLAPFSRGIYSILSMAPKKGVDIDEGILTSLFGDYYQGSKFVHVLPAGQSPQVKMVSGSNYCHIGFAFDNRTGRVTVISSIDNLVKGAAGQAVQNMNIIFGLDEGAGLGAPGVYP